MLVPDAKLTPYGYPLYPVNVPAPMMRTLSPWIVAFEIDTYEEDPSIRRFDVALTEVPDAISTLGRPSSPLPVKLILAPEVTLEPEITTPALPPLRGKPEPSI
jgi:hypothetical protein